MVGSKSLKVAIHHRKGSFSDRWIEYCLENQIEHSVVNCYDNNIVDKLKKFDMLLWNWYQGNHCEVRSAPHVIAAAEKMGIVVFPSTDTCRTFDNKVAQKYQLESIGAPLVPTYIFYDEKSACEWLDTTTFPKVFKLSRGAGALNVRLVKSRGEGRALVRQAFYRGFQNVSGQFKENIGILTARRSRGFGFWFAKIKRLPSTLLNIHLINKMMGHEIGYVYFQEFIPNLKYDTRVVVIGNKAFAFRREVRKNDFRASGSGMTLTDPEAIDLEFIKIGFEVSDKLNLQSAAYDFIRDAAGLPYLIELSYTFPSSAQVKDLPGYWDKSLHWYAGAMWPQDAIISDLIATV